jgi:hypothetical protein
MIATGTYHPNQTGARTLAEAKPLYVGGQRVSVEVSEAEVTLFVGGEIKATAERSRFAGPADLASWANEVALAPETETVNGLAVETVTAEELREQDMVVVTVLGTERFAHVTAHSFRPTYFSRRTGREEKEDTVRVSISGTRSYVSPETTYRRALDREAASSQEWERYSAAVRAL